MFNLQDYAISLQLDDRQFREETYQKRISLINLATQWPGETERFEFIFHSIWQCPSEPSYKVSLGKFGKEYYEMKDGKPKNSNDMYPSVLKDGQVVSTVRGRFDDIFLMLEQAKDDPELLSAFATLFIRNSLLLDHSFDQEVYTYAPPRTLIEYITAKLPEYEGIPTEVYIHFLDAIGFNEDVKYFTQEKLSRSNGIGRENNMKTYANYAACLLGKKPMADIIYSLMRGMGVAPLKNSEIASFFPFLNVTYRPSASRTRRTNREEAIIKDEIEHF